MVKVARLGTAILDGVATVGGGCGRALSGGTLNRILNKLLRNSPERLIPETSLNGTNALKVLPLDSASTPCKEILEP